MATFTIVPKDVNWLKDPIWVEIEESTLINSSGEPQEDNLSAYFEVKQNGAFLTEFAMPYNLATRKTDLDLSGIANCFPEAPEDGSMKSPSSGILDHPAVYIDIEHRNMYGLPAVKQSPIVSIGSFTVIYGHTPYWYGIGLTGSAAMLHSYYTMDGFSAIKELRKEQPEYLYIYSHDGSSIEIYVEILYTDETSDTVSFGDIAMGAKKVTWVNVGWNARSMDTYVDSEKIVNQYVVHITGGDGFHETVTYAIDDHPTIYDQYLLYENGLGGCEVIRCSGRHTIGVSGKKELIQYSRIRGRTYRDGFRKHVNGRGSEQWRMNTGYQNQHYIRHLQQLFISESVWYIDMVRETFHSVTISEDSQDLIDFENDLYSCSFTMTFDDRPGLNTFKI